MRRWWHGLALLALTGWGLLLITRCHLPRQATAPSADSTSAVYVIRHGWHAGIAVRRADLPTGAWPVLDAFPDARYLEVGWGEARYYPGESRGLWGAIRAGGWPSSSVLHVVPLGSAVQASFPKNTIARVPVSAAELEALTRYVAASFDTTAGGAARPTASGYFPNSQFFASGLTYHVFNNCNHWAAGALEAAGCDTSPRWTFTVGRVIRQAQRCGTLLQRAPDD